jgi:peptidyl-prolyl cis-trans isomerase-like 4
MKPPENVLFVCKLNPVTNDDDLELIFSRFGKINSCEVIRDKKTGDSLCYAFIEFDKQEDCESAYFKMDNVLIDDRRIHVDFSQSVAKVNWKGKGTGTGYFADDRNYRNGGGSGGGGSGRNNENNSNQRNKSSGDNVIYNKKSSKSDSRYDLVFDDNEIEQMDQSNRYGRQYEPVASSTADQRRHNHQRQQYQQNADSGNHERYDRSRDDRDRDRNRGGGGHSSHSRDRERERDHRENRSNNGDRSKDRDREKERDRDRDRHNHHHHKESSKSSSSHHRR